MITFPVTRIWHEHAKKVSKAFGETHHGGGKDDYIGTLGELAFGRLLKENGLRQHTDFEYHAKKKTPYDFLIKGERWDVKTRRVTANVQPTWLAMVKEAQVQHECDMYCFAVVEWRRHWIHPKSVHLLRVADKNAYMNRATRVLKGEKLGQWQASMDCRTVPYNAMWPVEMLPWILNNGRYPSEAEMAAVAKMVKHQQGLDPTMSLTPEPMPG